MDLVKSVQGERSTGLEMHWCKSNVTTRQTNHTRNFGRWSAVFLRAKKSNFEPVSFLAATMHEIQRVRQKGTTRKTSWAIKYVGPK